MAIETVGPQTRDEKLKEIAKAKADITKEIGPGSIMNLGDKVGGAVAHIPTGIWDLDTYVLGIGGVARGRLVEVFGSESGGKTTLSLLLIAQAQAADGMAAFIDAEHALDPTWAAKQGVRVDDLLVSQPDTGEECLRIAQRLMETRAMDLIVIDSVSALVPKAEIDGEIGDSHVGLQARLMSQACRMLAPLASKTDTTVIFINQIREKIGVSFGSPETTSGGRALRFYASVRLDVRRIGQVKEDDCIIGNKTKIKCVKNKLAPPYRETEVDLLYDSGLDWKGSLFDAAVEKELISKSGSWFSYKGERIGQGRRKSIDSDVFEHYYAAIHEALTKVRDA